MSQNICDKCGGLELQRKDGSQLCLDCKASRQDAANLKARKDGKPGKRPKFP